MRHVFIINPAAGKRDCTAQLLEMAKGLEARHGLAVERILTRRPGHAWEAHCYLLHIQCHKRNNP